MEWFCNKCHIVFNSSKGECCGKTEAFELEKHGRQLISSSNAWITFHKQIRKHPYIEEVASQMIKDGCHSAPIIMISAFERLLEQVEEECDE